MCIEPPACYGSVPHVLLAMSGGGSRPRSTRRPYTPLCNPLRPAGAADEAYWRPLHSDFTERLGREAGPGRTAPSFRAWSTMTLVLPAVIAASASNVVVDVNLDNVTHQLNPSALAPHPTDPATAGGANTPAPAIGDQRCLRPWQLPS